MEQRYDLVVLVNPNNPTGRHISRTELEGVLRRVPAQIRVWINEAYIDYLGAAESLERFAAESENVIVCKSMSKVYALSGTRHSAYSCSILITSRASMICTATWSATRFCGRSALV